MEQLTEEAEQSPVASDEQVARIRTKAGELLQVESELRDLEEKQKQLSQRRNELRHKELPDLLSEFGLDSLGLPQAGEYGADLVSTPYYHANIAAEWDPEQRQAAFEYLDSIEAGDLVKNIVTLSFSREESELAAAYLEILRGTELRTMLEAKLGRRINWMPEPVVDRTVPWNTLTAFVKEQIESGASLDLEKLGATVGSVAKIKFRKERKTSNG